MECLERRLRNLQYFITPSLYFSNIRVSQLTRLTNPRLIHGT
jgi:hypothetical protein